MTKAQIVAVFLAGAGAGAAPGAIIKALSTGAVEAAPAKPSAHAVDLRRQFDGSRLQYAVYGSRQQTDAGYVDLGPAKKCRPLTADEQKALAACMGIAGQTCEW